MFFIAVERSSLLIKGIVGVGMMAISLEARLNKAIQKHQWKVPAGLPGLTLVDEASPT
jgi:hypothetical protein